MELNQFKPKSKLVTKQTTLEKPRFPVIDAHNHLADPFGGGWDKKPLRMLLDELDAAGVVHYIDLDGGWGEEILNRHLDTIKNLAPERFSVFGGVDWSQWAAKGNSFPEWAARRLQIQKEHGAEGVKIWKPFGLSVTDANGQLVRVDDSRLDPIWQTCSELHLPVTMHVADPVAFFDPLDETNERWEELSDHPDWVFDSPAYPRFLEVLEGFKRLILHHPSTIFIGAHVGCYAENLAWIGDLLEQAPNFYVDISARIGELGRQPYSARKFFLKYAERIVFGLDEGPDVNSYRLAYRFLETDDEYFNYNTSDVPSQGRWYVNGLFLPDEVLEKVYRKNASRLLKL